MTSFPGPAFPARARRLAALERLLTERILVLDGAMGTMIQRHDLSEADFSGERLAAHLCTCLLKQLRYLLA